MDRARKHQRLFSVLAFGLLALVAELVGRGLTHRIDVGSHIGSPVSAGAGYYPALLAGVKLGIALLLARLAWRVAKARSAEMTSRRVLTALGSRPRVRLRLSARLWLAFFVVTSLIYLVQTDAEGLAAGRWPLVAPWLHSSALPVFAVLAVLMALLWGAVQRWLADYERYVLEASASARSLIVDGGGRGAFPAPLVAVPPRRLFGLAFESRPPPALA
jgi:hypothetical protein